MTETNIIICENCKRKEISSNITRLRWNKKNVDLYLCPKCASKFFLSDLKDSKIEDWKLKLIGLYQEGAREVDIKSFIEKWTKTKILKQ